MKKELTIKNGNMYYNNLCLKELADKYGTPLRVTFLDVIKNRVCNLKDAFNVAKEKNNYKGNLIYVNANKANYECQEIETAFIYGDGLETSSYNDLLLTKEIYKKYNEKNKIIICNGFKDPLYINEIIKINNEGYNIMTIVDNLDEYNCYKNAIMNKPLEIGLRIHIPSLYSEEEEVSKNDRFGLIDSEFNEIIKDIKNCKNLNLTTIHFHQRGFDYDKEKFLENILKVFNNYYLEALKNCPNIKNFDIGGGTPLPMGSDFDYISWFDLIQLTIRKASKNQLEPNIISENGKYSQKDSTVNIYNTVGVKNTDVYPWYLLDGSLLIAIPEDYALGEDILITPITDLDKEMVKARLSSITCDCDDIYFEKDKGYINLPKYEKNKNVYVGVIGTGSYQSSMNGKGGWHHCLLPQEKDVVVYTKDGILHEFVRGDLQNIENIKKLVHYDIKL